MEINNTPSDLKNKNYGIYISTTVGGKALDKRMEDLDVQNHRDYEYVINQKYKGKYVGVLFLMSEKGEGRWVTSLGMKGFSRISAELLIKGGYELWK